MATPQQIKALAGLYVAYFDRAPDPEGLQFWITQLDNGRPFNTIAQDFARSTEAREIYPFLSTPDLVLNSSQAFITSIYANLFGRAPDQEGLDFWTLAINSGAVAPGDMVEAIMLGAQDTLVNGQLIQDKTIVANKIECALEWTNAVVNIEGFEFDAEAYAASRAAIDGVGADQASVDAAKLVTQQYINEFATVSNFALQQATMEVVMMGDDSFSDVMVDTLMWGNPETGEGIPISEFFAPGGYFSLIASQAFAGVSEIDTDEDAFSIIDFSAVQSIDVVPTQTGDNTGQAGIDASGGIITFNYTDGSTDDIALGNRYYDLLTELMFVDVTETGSGSENTRFFTQTAPAQLPVYVTADGGTTTVASEGVGEPIGYVDATLVTPGATTTMTVDVPLILTTTVNNGSTTFFGFTSADNDVIVAPTLDLLHAAYIDGGLGQNTLEVDAKGHFAQPKALLNIQTINVQNLPNIYTDNDNDSTYPDLSGTGATESILDLSRATALENLTITEGSYDYLDSGNSSAGDLAIIGVRNDATVTLSGGFNNDVYITTTGGHPADGFTVVLNNVLAHDGDANLFIADNASKLNLISEGGGSNLNGIYGYNDNRVTDLVISGNASLFIEDGLDNLMEDETPLTIDASANFGGVDLNIEGGEFITFIGSKGDDRFSVIAEDEGGTSQGPDFGEDSAVVITNTAGNNFYDVDAKELTLTDADGDITVKADTDLSTITLGDGDNTVAVETAELSLTLGDGDNNVDIDLNGPSAELVSNDEFDKVANITAGDGENTIRVEVQTSTADVAEVNVTAGNGGNTVEVTQSSGSATQTAITINTGTGADTIVAEGSEINITSGGGNDDITIVGTDNDYASDSVDIEADDSGVSVDGNDVISRGFNDGVLLNIDTGAGSATITLGVEGEDDSGFAINNVIAKEGSVITGTDITLNVNTYANLIAADVSGVTSVVLDDDAGDRTDRDQANDLYDGERAQLTVTMDQFLAIGADNMSVEGAIFNTQAFVKIIVTESTSLAALGVNDLPRNIDLYIEIADGATLTMTAAELHTRIARDGITLADDGNTDLANGNVVITGGGENFDPFNTNDTVQTNINGQVYFGGSISTNDFSDGNGNYVNVTVQSVLGGYNRPADVQSEIVLTIDSEITPVVDGLESFYTNVEIVGDADIEFTDALNLGLFQGDSANLFTIDFSELGGQATGLTIGNFETVEQVIGNGIPGTEVFVEISADADDAGSQAIGFDDDQTAVTGVDQVDDRALISSGVSQYTVTVIGNNAGGDTATIRLCDKTEDLEVLAFRGNYKDTLVIENAAWGLVFDLEGGSTRKVDGPTGTSNVGTLKAIFEWDGAPAIINIVHSNSADTRPLHVEGIDIENAASIEINADGPAAIIENFKANGAETLTANAAGDLTIVDDIEGSISTIDARGVVGAFAADVDGENFDGPFTFTGGDGGSTLTLDDFGSDAHTIDGGVGGVHLVIDWGTNDLSNATLTNVTSVTLNDGASLTLTMDQADAIGATNFFVEQGDSAGLMLVDLSDQVFALANYPEELSISITLVDDPIVTLNPLTDLTGIASLVVPAGTTLFLTMAQFQQLDGAGTITGDGNVVITDATQADVGASGEDLNLDDLDVTGTVSVILAEDLDLSAAEITHGDPVVDSFEIGDGMTLTLDQTADADGVGFVGGADSTLRFMDVASEALESVDASGFDVDTLLISNTLVADRNVDRLFFGLPERVTKEIYTGIDFVEGVTQNVIIEEGTTVPGFLGFVKPEADVELRVLNLTLEGGTEIEGDLLLSSSSNEDGRLDQEFQELNIVSTGTAENLITGETANIIDGDITSQGTFDLITGTADDDNYLSVDGDLLTVNISGDQDFVVTGSIIFEEVTADGNAPFDDGLGVNDNTEETATLNVNGSASVYIDDIDTDDDDVDFLVINNLGTGDLNIGISDTNTVDADDVITYNGSVEGTDTIRVTGTRDFSGDTLIDVDQMVFDSASADTTITVTQAQFDAIGVENFLTTEDDDNDDENAILNITELGENPFDATALDTDIDLNEITIVAEDNVTLDPSTNLTSVSQINVPGGTTLNLTAAQFQQLDENGTIVSTNGEPINVNITGLTQADIDGGSFDLGGIDPDGGAVTLSLAESVELSEDDDLTLGGDDSEEVEVLLADGQDLGLAKFEQADGLDVTGTGTTDVFFRFMTDAGGESVDFFTTLDASGFDVSQLHALNTFVGGTNIEFILDDLPSSTTLVIYYDPEQLGVLNETDRVVIIEAGTTVDNLLGSDAALAFNDLDNGDEVRSVTITGLGGTIIDGDIVIGTETESEKDAPRNLLQSFTFVSEGDGSQVNADDETTTANVINGDITPFPVGFGALNENSLLDVELVANNTLDINGTLFMNNAAEDDAVATLATSGTADIQIDEIRLEDEFAGGSGDDDDNGEISEFVIDHTGAGTLEIVGDSDGIEMGSTPTLTFTGTGNIVFDTFDGDVEDTGVDGDDVLETLDASGLSGNLNVGAIESVNSGEFALVSGTGVTIAQLRDSSLDSDGDDDTPNTADDLDGWTIDYSDAAPGSKFTLGDDLSFDDGSTLNIDMGANGTLCIAESYDLSQLSFTFNGDLPIVLESGVELTLTAEQASGLNIVAAPDADPTPSVTIVDLGAYEDLNDNGSNDDAAELFDYDFSGIQVPASATLFDDDVTLSAASDLGNVAINLYALSNDNETLAGQTIRFNSEDQADGRVINVVDGGGDYVNPGEDGDTTNSTNVIWLFDSVSDTLDTSNYDPEIGRVWFTEELANGANIEDLFSSLPEAILRVDFGDLTDLETLLQSVPVDRTIELASFVELPDGIEFSDLDQLEHIESLTVKMGGEVTVGDILIGNIVDPEDGLNSGSITFDTLTIDSVLADDTGDLLASEGYDEDDNVRPEGVNVVGDIGVGPNDNLNEFGLDLTEVILNVGNAQLGEGGSDYIEATQALIEAYDNGSGGNDDTYEALVAVVDTYGEELLDFLDGSIEITGVPGGGDVTLTSKDELLDYLELIELDIVAALTNAGNWSDILSAINGFGAAEFGASSGDIADGDADTGADLVVGTITFDTEGTDETATLDVNGENFIDIKAVDVSDAGFTSFVIDVTEFPDLADLTFTGGSPAVTLGENVETMSISGEEVFGEDEPSVYEQIIWSVGEDLSNLFDPNPDTIRFGYEWVDTNEDGIRDDDEYIIHRDGEGNPYAGIYGPELSLLEVDGNSGHDVHFGYLADIDGTDDGPFSPAFELIGDLTGQTTSATLGAANVDGDIVAPELEAGSTWRFVDVDLTIDEETIFQDDSNLEIFESNLFITDGNDVDLSGVNLDIDNSTIRVEEGGSLTLTVEQVLDLLSEGIIITGSGTVNVVGDATADYTYDFGSGDLDLDDIELAFALGSVLKTSNVNVSGVTIDTDTDNGGGFSLGLFGGALPDSIEADTIAYLEATEAIRDAYASGSGDNEETYLAFSEWADTYAGDFIDAFGPIEITGAPGPDSEVTLASEQDTLDYLFLIRNDIVSALSNGDNWTDLDSGFEAFLELQFFNKGQSVVGSDNDDLLITLNLGDNTFEGGEGNDVYIGDFGSGGFFGSGDLAPGNNTYVVTSGLDIIFNLEADEISDSDEVWFKQDILTVAEDSRAYGLVSDEFVATSETTNDGEAILIGGGIFGGGDTLLDVSEAGGTAGFTLVGGAASGDVFGSGSGDFFDEILASAADLATGEGAEENVSVLIGSANDDTIIDGGLASGDNDGVEDTLTGNEGSDTFLFNIGLSDIAELSDDVTQENYDIDFIDFSGSGSGSDELTVRYEIDGIEYIDLIVDGVNDVDFTDRSTVAQELANRIEARPGNLTVTLVENGASGSGTDDLQIVSTDGSYFNIASGDLDLAETSLSVVFDEVGDTASGDDATDSGDDDAQVTTVTVTLDGLSVGGEVYSILIDPLQPGASIEAAYTAVAGNNAEAIALGLVDAINAFSRTEVTVVQSGNTFTISTSDNGDLGGFEIMVLNGTSVLEASSASSILLGTETSLADADADEVTDFMVDDDFISFGLGAGNDDNFDSGQFVDTYAEAYAEADEAFDIEGLVYFFIGYNDDASGDADEIEGDVGLLFVNANGSETPDTVVQLTGVSEGTFDFDNIV